MTMGHHTSSSTSRKNSANEQITGSSWGISISTQIFHPIWKFSKRANAPAVTFINQFLLKMVVPRSIAYPQSPPPNTPKLLEFVGISKHFENEITSQEEKWEREKAEA